MLKILVTNWIHIFGLILTMIGVSFSQYGEHDLFGSTLLITAVAAPALLLILSGVMVMDVVLFLKRDNQVYKKLLLESLIVFGSVFIAFRSPGISSEDLVRSLRCLAIFIAIFLACQIYKSWRIKKISPGQNLDC